MRTNAVRKNLFCDQVAPIVLAITILTDASDHRDDRPLARGSNGLIRTFPAKTSEQSSGGHSFSTSRQPLDRGNQVDVERADDDD